MPADVPTVSTCSQQVCPSSLEWSSGAPPRLLRGLRAVHQGRAQALALQQQAVVWCAVCESSGQPVGTLAGESIANGAAGNAGPCHQAQHHHHGRQCRHEGDDGGAHLQRRRHHQGGPAPLSASASACASASAPPLFARLCRVAFAVHRRAPLRPKVHRQLRVSGRDAPRGGHPRLARGQVGIGPGSVCTTRKQTGVGYPQLSVLAPPARV